MVGLSRRCESSVFLFFFILWGRLLPDTDIKVYYSNLASVLNLSPLRFGSTLTSIPGDPVDESYKEVKRQIDAGLLGTPYLIKSATNDMYDPSGESRVLVWPSFPSRIVSYSK